METRSVFFCSYSVGTEVYRQVPELCSPFGSRALVIGGRRAMAAGLPKLREALEDSGLKIVHAVEFGEDCTGAQIDRWAEYARELDVDMIFGMGGGKALDTAKGAAFAAGLPVFTFPTIAATCAGTTALSVVYREDGSFDRFAFFPRPARHCFIDLDILARAPWKYLQAGMGDTIGKFFECHFAARGDKLAHSSALGREISNMCYTPLLEYGVQALSDCRAGRATHALKQAVLAVVVSTGLVSLLVLDQYNCAIAHSVDYGLILLPGFEKKFLHGSVVAYGVLVQLAVDQDWDRAREVKAFLRRLEIPTTLGGNGGRAGPRVSEGCPP